MPKLTYYRQERVDRGIRTGITLEDYPIFHRFEEGDDEPDPTILWFVDLRCEGDSLPKEPNAARQWFLSHAAMIKKGFLKCAEQLKLGSDPDIYPVLWSKFSNPPPGVKMTIAYATTRHAQARLLPKILNRVAKSWKSSILSLEPFLPAHH